MSNYVFTPANAADILSDIIKKLNQTYSPEDLKDGVRLLEAIGQLKELAKEAGYVVQFDIKLGAGGSIDAGDFAKLSASAGVGAGGAELSASGGFAGWEASVDLSLSETPITVNRSITGGFDIPLAPGLAIFVGSKVKKGNVNPSGGNYRDSVELSIAGGAGVGNTNLSGGISVTAKIVSKDEYIDTTLAQKLFSDPGNYFAANPLIANGFINAGIDFRTPAGRRRILDEIKSTSSNRSNQSLFITTAVALYNLTGLNVNWGGLPADDGILEPSRQTYALNGGLVHTDVSSSNPNLDLTPKLFISNAAGGLLLVDLQYSQVHRNSETKFRTVSTMILNHDGSSYKVSGIPIEESFGYFYNYSSADGSITYIPYFEFAGKKNIYESVGGLRMNGIPSNATLLPDPYGDFLREIDQSKFIEDINKRKSFVAQVIDPVSGKYIPTYDQVFWAGDRFVVNHVSVPVPFDAGTRYVLQDQLDGSARTINVYNDGRVSSITGGIERFESDPIVITALKKPILSDRHSKLLEDENITVRTSNSFSVSLKGENLTISKNDAHISSSTDYSLNSSQLSDIVRTTSSRSDVFRYDSAGRMMLNAVGKPIVDGFRTQSVVTYTSGPKTGITTIKSSESPIGIEFDRAGAILGNLLGKSLAGDDKLVRIGTSALFKTIGQTFGDVLDSAFDGANGSNAKDVAAVLASFDDQLIRNLSLKAVGAVSAFLASELIDAIGVDGFVGEVANTALSELLRSQIANVVGIQSNATGANIAGAVGALIGTKLASEIVTFGSVGGQLGSSIGAAAGSLLIGSVLGVTAGTTILSQVVANFLLPGVGAFVGFLIGGLIGSVFGGTPRSGADSQWDATQQKFIVANLYSKKGGSKDAARSVASAVSETFNSVLAATGGTLLNAEAVQSGNYGMRKSDFVYRPYSTQSKDAITQRFSGKNAATQLIGYGVYQGLTDPDFQIAGGDVYVKRALYATFDMGGLDPRNFDTNVLLGNISSAQSYESYLHNSSVINALVAAESDSVFTTETLITLARADELGLTRRSRSDWFGGFSYLMDEAQTNAANVEFGFDYDPSSDQVSRLIGVGDYVLGDTIDIAGQTTIEGTANGDIIDLRSGSLASQLAYTVNGVLQDQIAVSGVDFVVPTVVSPATSAQISYTANSQRISLPITIKVNAANSGREVFDVSLISNDTVAATIIGPPATVTIVPDSDLPYLMVGRSYAAEKDGYALFRVSLSKAISNNAISFSLALSDDGATGGGVDYGTASGSGIELWNGSAWVAASTATIAQNTLSVSLRVAIKDDNGTAAQPLNVEGNERFTLTATVTAGATLLANGGTPVSGVGTIVDATQRDPAKPLTWLDDIIVHEPVSNTRNADLVINRSQPLSTAITLGYKTSDRRALNIDVAATVDGGAGNDTIYGSNLGDNLFGGTGNDTLYGGRLDDWLLGGDGDDILDAGSTDAAALAGDGNYLNGGAGNDTLRGREGSDWLDGGDGIDILTGGAGDDILAGGAGVGDSLKGGTGSDQYLVRRGDNADIAEEDATGAPVAVGGINAIKKRMEDIKAGVIKADWAGTSAGVQSGQISGGDDAVVFGDGIDVGDIRLQRSGTPGALGADLIIVIMTTVNGIEGDSGTRLTIKDWFTNPFKRVEWLKFADGNEMRIGDLSSFIAGGTGDDVLIGTSGNDFVYGGAGNDKLSLLDGDDVGNGATGDDMVSGGTGQDILIGGLGSDLLLGDAGSDTITGDAGADEIYGGADDTYHDSLDARKDKGGDVLSGGRGDNDWVVGGSGDDTFKYARGDGRDIYFDEYANYWEKVVSGGVWNSAGGYTYTAATGEVTGPGGAPVHKNFGTVAEPDFKWVGRFSFDSTTSTLWRFNPPAGATTITANSGVDTIDFAPGINLQDVILRRPTGSNDLVLAISSEDEELGDTSLAKDSITIKDWYLSPGQIEKLAFYQTGILEIASNKMTLIAGTDGIDGTTSTPLAGTSIADWITGAAGDDVIAGGGGNDIIAGNTGFDTIKGEAGDDVLYGGTGNDILDGGAGKDVLVGGAGQDAASYASSSSGVKAQLTAASMNAGDAIGDQYYAIEDLIGSSGSDVLGGDNGQNELTGGLGNDTLLGNTGDDTYVWNVGDGNDTVIDNAFVMEEAVTTGGTLSAGYSVKSWADNGTVNPANGNRYWRLQIQASDGTIVYDIATYSYAPGVIPATPSTDTYDQNGWLGGFARTNGKQVTRQRFDTAVNAGSDELEYGANISLNDLDFIKSGNDLKIRYAGSSSAQVTLKDQLLVNSAVETLKLADGLAISLTSVLTASSSAQLVGTSVDDLMVGQSGTTADNLSGGDGNDALVGYAGNDLLYGGNGDDVFEGGLGADRLDGGANSLSSAGPNAGDTARYVRSAAAVTVDLNLATAQAGATGSDSVGDILIGIENVVGSAFDDTLTGDVNDNRLFGLDGMDTLYGGAGADILVGDGGNDKLYGDAGEDGLAGGDGNDQLYGGTENDTLDGGDGNDTLYGNTENDTLTGGAGADYLSGGDGDDTLVGGADNDQLFAGIGNDVVSGGLGNDTIQDSGGNDSYAFERFSGSDTLLDIYGSNVLTFDSSVSYDQLWLTRVGNDLRVAVIGGDTVALVTGFFLSTGQSRVHAIQTTTHAIFLDHPDSLNLVTAMTTATTTPGVTPAAMPATVTPLLATYWHAGGKAIPTGPASPRAVTLLEDASLTIDGNYGVVDHDQNVVSYSIKVGGEPTKGTISNFNTATGALTYSPLADVNGTDSFIVIATDADGQSVELPVNVTITPVNDAPRNLAVVGGVLTVLESAPGSTTVNGTKVGQFTALDVEGNAITYSLANDAGGRFTITAAGELRVLDATKLDRELSASHVVQVIATDALNAAGPATSFTVTIGNVNEAPNTPVLSSSRGIAAEFVSGVNSTNTSTLVAQFTTSDPDGAPAPGLAFDSAGNPGGRFKIVGTQVQFAGDPDFEALVGAGFAVTDSDSDGLNEVTLTGKVQGYDGARSSANSASFSVKIEDVNEQHTAIALASAAASIDERDRLAAGTARPEVILGTLSVTDLDLAGQLTGQHLYAVYEGSASTVSTRFGVNAANKLTLLANQSLDYETDGTSITLKVRATDKSSTPLFFDQNFTFAINNKDDVVDGTASVDTLTGQQNRDILRGFAGNDTLSGMAGNDQLEGGDGNDTLNGGDGDDTLLGQIGNDRLNGDIGNDTLSGGDGSDVLDGGVGNDTLNGDAGDDGVRESGTDAWRGFSTRGLIGGDGTDILNGGDGDDYLEGGLGADQLNGGLGFDGISYEASTAAVTINLATGTGVGGSAQGDTISGIELVKGSNYADAFTGSSGSDVLNGGAGNDTINAGAGNDFLIGGGGDDTLNAEAGNDYLDGGLGNDTLIGGADNDTYFVGRNQGNDRIQNFDSTGTNFDHLTFESTVLYTDVWFDRVDNAGAVSSSGNHLKMTLLGAAGYEGTITVDNWFTVPDRTLPENYFKIDLISDGNDRAALPVNVDALVTLMAGIPQANRPTTQAQLASLRSSNQSFRISMEEYWGRLSAPKISDTVAITGVEALDNGTTTVSFAVRAWFEDDYGLGVTIPAENIDLTLTATGGYAIADYVTSINTGSPDANGNRTVTVTLASNASTHLLPGEVLPLQLQAKIRGTTRTALDPNGLTLTITPTADTPSLSQLASTGGNAGSYIPLSITAGSADTDGSERVDVLIKGLPSGYSFTNAAGAAVGTFEAGTTWRLRTADLTGLKMFVSTGRYENAVLTIAAQSIDGSSVLTSAWTPLTIVVNGTPTNVTLTGSVAENTATGAFVGTLAGIDPDTNEGAGAPSSFQLLNNAGGRYVLDTNNTSRLLVANGGSANFDFEAANRDGLHTITVRVTDGTGLYVDKQIVVPVTNVNEAPNAPSNGVTTWSFFDETGLGSNPATTGATVASFGLSDPDGTTPTLQFAPGGVNGHLFTIVGNQVRFAANTNLDYEWFRNNGGYGLYDWNSDGRLEAHIADVYVQATDGTLTSAPTLLQVFISDVNERPNNLIVEASNIFSETLNGDTPHSELLIARFTMADPDGASPNLVIVGGNNNGWFQSLYGNHIGFSSGVNFTADWFRANKGQWGTDADFYSDVDGDGLKEIRVATLMLKAQDAYGAQSDAFAYNVLIEDKNEAPVWAMSPFTFGLNENPIWYQYVGTVGGSDIDGPSSELRYVFSNWDRYFDNTLGQWASRSADQRFVMSEGGSIYVNGTQGLDYETPAMRNFSYQTLIYDKAFGANNTYNYGTLNINLQDVNEQHLLVNASGAIPENTSLPPFTPYSPNFNLRTSMLSDPEGRNMSWSFADGSYQSGIWSITTAGIVYLTNGTADYEALTTRYETSYEWDPRIQEPVEVTTAVRDYSLATQNLSVRAYDGQYSVNATFAATVSDANDPLDFSAGVSGAGKGQIIQQSATSYYVMANTPGTNWGVQIYAVDPDGTTGASYSIASVNWAQMNGAVSQNSEINATGYPSISISQAGKLSFFTPNQASDGEWEGGLKDPSRRTVTLVATVAVTMADAYGLARTENFVLTFLRRGSSVPPIALDLDGDGVELIAYDGSEVTFDMDADGIRDRTGWVSADDGLLALDRNSNGSIDSIEEISFVGDVEGALTDGEGLRAYDTNNDGFLDADDERFAEFKVWQDVNQNGISEADELRGLSDHGIQAINLTLTATGAELGGSENTVFATLDLLKTDGTTSIAADVFLTFDPSAIPDETDIAAPIVFDFDADGADLVSLANSSALFDMNSDGIADKTGWIEQGDALLALDRNGNGTIDNIGEISFVGDKAGAKTDLEGLAGFDSNADGVLDGEDEKFVEFKLWFDGNSNGKTDAGELLSLAEAGVNAISLQGVATGATQVAGNNIVYNTSTYSLGNGTAGRLLDAGFAFKALSALPETVYQKSDWVGKAKNYRIASTNGTVHVTPNRAKGEIDAGAGLVSPAAILNFDNRYVGMLSTILVDLDGDGLEARRMQKTGAVFDMDGDGTADDTGWAANDDGLLVIDRDGNGVITDPSELSFLSEKADAKNSWEALATLDSNKDSRLSATDARFGELKVWTDANANGVTEAGELKSLTDLGISEIGLASTAVTASAKIGNNLPLSTATFKWTSGITGTIGNVALAFDPSSAKKVQPVEPSEAIQVNQAAASQLLQAMSSFGAGASEGSLQSAAANQQDRQDWFAASAA